MVFSVIYILLLYTTIFVPAIELITIFFLPIPFVYFTSKHGLKRGISFFIINLLVVSLFIAVLSIPFTILAGLGGTLIGLAIHEKLSAYETWARGTLGFVLGLVSIFVFIQLFFGINVINEFNETISESVEMSQDILSNFGLEPTASELEMIEEQMLQVIQLIPVFLVIIAMIIGFLTQWLSYKLLNRKDKLGLKFPPFRNFKLPKVVIWIYFIAILLTWLQFEQGTFTYQGVINVTNLTAVLITLQGFSFILYYVYIKKLSKVIPVIAIIMCILFPFMGLYMIRILGIIDLGFSLRERIEKK
nr:YybS family protein [Aquibacillus albus]